jgi:DNA mismatch repair protein MutS
VIARAEEVLALLEKDQQAGATAKLANDLPLFAALARPASKAATVSAVEQALAEVTPDALSPREALETLYRLKALTPPTG